MGNSQSGPRGDPGPKGEKGDQGDPGPPGVANTEEIINNLLKLDSKFIEPLTKRLGEDSSLATSVSKYLMDNVDEFETRVADKIKITPIIKQDLADSLKSNSEFITGVSGSILNNDYTKNLLESKLLAGNDSVFTNEVANTLVKNYQEQLRGKPGDIGDLDSLKLTMTPRTIWCADGDIYCELPKVSNDYGDLSGNTKNLKEIVISNINKDTTSKNFSRWKLTANDNEDNTKFNEFNIVPFSGVTDGTNKLSGYKLDKSVKVRYTGNPETTELHVPGKIVSEQFFIKQGDKFKDIIDIIDEKLKTLKTTNNNYSSSSSTPAMTNSPYGGTYNMYGGTYPYP